MDRTLATDTDYSTLFHTIKYSLKPVESQDQDEWDKFQLGQGTFTINEDTGQLGKDAASRKGDRIWI